MQELNSQQLAAVSGAKDIKFSFGILEFTVLDSGPGKLPATGVSFIKPIRKWLGLSY